MFPIVHRLVYIVYLLNEKEYHYQYLFKKIIHFRRCNILADVIF